MYTTVATERLSFTNVSEFAVKLFMRLPKALVAVDLLTDCKRFHHNFIYDHTTHTHSALLNIAPPMGGS